MLELGVGRALGALAVLAFVVVFLPERPLLALVIVIAFVYLPVYRLLRRWREAESNDLDSTRRSGRER